MDTPIRMLESEQIAPDTHVIRQLAGEGFGPVSVFVNSMVITGAEPVIVDAGPSVSRGLWLDTVFGIVEPADVRWIFLSHDDIDHTGNLREVLDLCPQATLLTNWFSVERMASDYMLPLERIRLVNDGDSFRAGDRELAAVVPPTFDSPTTRGLFDPKSGVYWASDSFGTPVTHEVADIDDLPPGFFPDAFLMMQTMLSPWHRWLDPVRFGAHLDRVRALGATTIAGAHGPTLRGAQVATAFELMAELPFRPAAHVVSQDEFEMMLAALTGRFQAVG